MNRIQVHLRVQTTKIFELVIPTGSDPEKYANHILQTDPTLKNSKVKNVHYDEDTELPISVKCYMYKQRRGLLYESRPLHHQCLKIAHYIGNGNEPLDALSKLKSQSLNDGSILADRVISLSEPFKNKFTVDELLNVVLV